MASRVANICFDANDPVSLATFWCSVLNWHITEQSDQGVSIAPVSGTGPVIDFLAVPETKQHKNRLHLDLRADGSSTSDERQRLLALGATTVDVGQSPSSSWVVFADPEGNEFCLLATAVQDLDP